MKKKFSVSLPTQYSNNFGSIVTDSEGRFTSSKAGRIEIE